MSGPSILKLAAVLAPALMLGGCDTEKAATGQGSATSATSGASASPNAAAFGPHVIDRAKAGSAMPSAAFRAPDGSSVTLAQLTAGKPAIVNLWATWCAPCIHEMPMLDAIGAAAQGRYRLITVSQFEDPTKVEAWLKQRNFTTVTAYTDADAALASAYAANLPTTILYDASGKEVLRVAGALDWFGPDGRALLKEAGIDPAK